MRRLLLALASLVLLAASSAGGQTPVPDGVATLLGRLEQTLRAGDPDSYMGLLGQTADRKRSALFASQNINSKLGRVAIRERDRVQLEGVLPGDGFQLLLEILFESGPRARLATWRVDVRRRGNASGGAPDDWAIVDQQVLTSLSGLHRLSLNPARQFTARDLVVTAEDLRLTLDAGSVFVAEADGSPTALVLLGRGEMTFTPSPKVEKDQVRLATGAETLTSPYEVAFLRLHPFDLESHLNKSALTERPVDPRDLKRADEVFRQEIGKTFGLDLGDLSQESWSLLPNTGDFVAEVRTRRFDALTYARSTAEIEDISLFDRKNRHHLAIYPSKEHVGLFGRFYSEDDQADYRVSHYDVDVAFDPDRQTLEGRARLNLECVTKGGTNSITFRLADSLNVKSVFTSEFGRLLFVRVRNQNAVVVNLPFTMTAGVRMVLTVEYGGTITPQPIDREGIGQMQIVEDELPSEASFLYSNRSYWYPQSPTPSYATALMRISVPGTYNCAASGERVSVVPDRPSRRPSATRQFTFQTTQPARYLAFLVSQLVEVRAEKLRLSSLFEAARLERPPGVYYDDVDVVTMTNPRLRNQGRDVSRTGQDILRFYASLVGDCPYPALTLALVERSLPGGHSPAFLAVVSQAAPGTRLNFRDDPASFPDFPEFFIAHELAHQWWGQAVGWKNYHEQWLSEGFAQYFAALYAEKARGPQVFDNMMRRMRRWALDESDQGPVYLGYRIGHVKNDGRLFRAVVYNKGATVLHMLRTLIGDRAFFAGIRRFYETWRFKKAGSDDLRRAMEAEAHVSLDRFFERWVYGQDLPQVTFTYRVVQNGDGQEALLRFEQAAETFDLPVVVMLDYVDRPPGRVVVRLGDRVVETRVPLAGQLRHADVSREETTAVIR
jgi:hypothetical protein